MPDFTFERTLSDSENEQADGCFDTLEAYLKAYLVKSEPAVEEEFSNDETEDLQDDLEF